MATRMLGMRMERDAAAPILDEPAPARPARRVGKRSLVEATPGYALDDAVGPVVQRARTSDAPAPVADVLRQLRGTGSALPDGVAGRMARLFGHSFAHVRVHADSEAATAARMLSARAFTVGDDVYFGAGEYAPGTATGDRLLVHELTHVVQFDDGRLASDGPTQLSHPDDATEREASAMEARSAEAVDAGRDARAHEVHAVAPEAQAAHAVAPEAQAAHAGAMQATQALRAMAVEAPVLPTYAYRSGQALIQRAIGFEIQTHFVVRKDGEDWLPYKEPVFVDERVGGKPYFDMVVDHAPVPLATEDDPRILATDSAVLEIVLPHVDNKASLRAVVRRADVMRRALATATVNGTREATIDAVVQQFEAMLKSEGHDEHENRAHGIKLAGAIVGQRGEPDSASTVLPQFTLGMPLSSIPIVIAFVMQQARLVDKKFDAVTSSINQTIAWLQESGLPLETAGLVLIVESYLACGRMAPEILEYAKEIAPWMARTNFHSMYAALSEDGKAAWHHYVRSMKSTPDADTIPQGFGRPLAPDTEPRSRGPKIHAWLDSISDPSTAPLDAIDHGRLSRLFYPLLRARMNRVLDGHALRDELHDAGSRDEVVALALQLETPPDNPPPLDADLLEELFRDLLDKHDGPRMCQEIREMLAELSTRDLMSRGAVNQSASSMGSMTVHDEGPEQGMAILENRMMPPWKTPPVQPPRPEAEDAQRDDEPTWVELVISTYEFLEMALGTAAKMVDLQPGADNDDEHERDGKRNSDEEFEPAPEGAPEGERPNAPRKRRRSPSPQRAKRVRGVDGRVHYDRRDRPTRVTYDAVVYKVVRVPADGNCFYECVSRALADGRDAMALRGLLANSALLTAEEQQAAQDPQNYAGDREIAALAAAVNRAIVTHEGTYEDVSNTVLRKPAVGAGTELHVLLLYNVADAQGHFNLMR